YFSFFFNDPAPTVISTLSLHDALPISFYNLPNTGERVTLFTHLVVREDAHLLYGFGSDAERRTFRQLLKVNGIGPRIALAVLSRSEEHTSELQSRSDLVCRLLLEKKKK